MAEAFDPDDVEKFLPAIAAVAARGLAGAGAKAAGKVAAGAKAAATGIKQGVKAGAAKIDDVAEKVKNATPEQKKKVGVALGAKQQMDQRIAQAEQRKQEQHQRASEMARSAASTGTTFGKAWDVYKQQTFNDYFGIKDQWISLPKAGMDQRPELYDEVAEAMNIAYAPIGGHAKYGNAADLQGDEKLQRYDMIDNDDDPYVDAAKVHAPTDFGFKTIASAQDGRRTSKEALKNYTETAINRTPGYYAELSDAWERFFTRRGIQPIQDMEQVRQVMAGKELTPTAQPGVYRRVIGNKAHEKGLYGSPLMEDGRQHVDAFMQQLNEAHAQGEPFVLDQDLSNLAFVKSNDTMEDAFDMGYELIDYDDLHDKQRAIVDLISNKAPSYWADPASGEYETEYYNSMFRPDTHHLYPDEAYEQYHRYLSHVFDAINSVSALPREQQLDLMDQKQHPQHPESIALARMAEEFPEWDVEDPHAAFYDRYNQPEPQRGLASRMASGGFLRSQVLVKERKSPEAMRHKREYDAAYNKRPDQVKYREELNRERRRRGIMGSHNHMDVSHTQGGKLTLEGEHSNRARHFKDKGTLRVVKSMKEDLELLRNLMMGPMDEQDKKIATAMVGMLEERHGDEEDEEQELMRPLFGGGDLFV